MKQRLQIALMIALVLLIGFGGYYAFREHDNPRPFFGNYSYGGRWSFGDALGLMDRRQVYYDIEEGVLLVVQVEPGGAVQWVIDAQPVGPVLRVRRQRDDVERSIEWRRDCIITLDGEGNPTYKSLSPPTLRRAVSTPIGWVQAFTEIIDGPSASVATRPSTRPTSAPSSN